MLTNDDLDIRPNTAVRLSLLNEVTFEEMQQTNKINEGSNVNPIEIEDNENEQKNDLIDQQNILKIGNGDTQV